MGEQETFLCIFFQFGLKCEGTKRVPCDFFFFFFEGRQAEVHCGISSQIGRLVLLRPIIPDS